jgi:DNA-binding MurR/RpiR family transcriptional regulator
MNETFVPSLEETAEPVLARLVAELTNMSPQLRKAAEYVVDNPVDVGISSIREIADAAEVKPNTLVRMARAIGYRGYEDFRRPFREELRAGRESFPDRARWLQSIAKGGRYGRLYGDMAATTMENIEQLFADTSAADLKAAADSIVAAHATYVLGVGFAYALAHNFAYLARMALNTVVAVPQDGSLPIDDIANVRPDDVLVAMTFEPYRREVVDAVHVAGDQGCTVVALSDSRASPIAIGADHVFVIPTETPQFFTSGVAAATLLEALVAFVVADAKPDVIANIERFHARRRKLGVYWQPGS